MSSIEEKLSAIREIIAHLQEFKNHINDDQKSISSQLSDVKGNWNDAQQERFSSSAYLGSFFTSLNAISTQVDKSIGFLENKYSTLETHRN